MYKNIYIYKITLQKPTEQNIADLSSPPQVVLPPGRPDYGRQLAMLELPPANVFGRPRDPRGHPEKTPRGRRFPHEKW